MAGERTLPGLGLTGFWTLGSPWKTGMDDNLRRLSVFAQLVVESRVAALPGSPTDGYIAIVPSGGEIHKVAVRDAGGWVYLSAYEGLRGYVKDTNELVLFNGTAWVPEPDMGIPEPPDDALYGRRGPDGGTPGYWDEVVEEAPTDGGAYVRSSGGWVPETVGGGGGGGDFPEAPENGKLYGRKDAAWAEIVAGEGGGEVVRETYSKYRLTIIENLEDRPTLGELEFYDEDNVKHIPIAATTSGAYDVGYGGPEVIDNNPATFFYASADEVAWIELEFAEPFAAKYCKQTVANERYSRRASVYTISAGDGGSVLLFTSDTPAYVGSGNGAYVLDEFDTPAFEAAYVLEAPEDGKAYGRQDAEWVEVAKPEGYSGPVIYRLLVNSTFGGGQLTIGDLFFYDEDDADRAITDAGATYQASSVSGFGSLAAAFNRVGVGGNDFWCPSSVPAWIQVSFPAYFQLAKVGIQARPDGGYDGQQANAFDVLMSIDGGTTFTTLLSKESTTNIVTPGQLRTYDVPNYVQPGITPKPYDMAICYPGLVTGNVVIRNLAVRDYVLEADFAGSVGYVATPPSAPITVVIRKTGIAVGYITIDAAGTVTFEAPEPTVVAPGDRLEVVFPADPLGMADFAITLAGRR